MTNYKYWKDEFGSALISMAVASNKELIEKIKYNEDGTLPIVFSVGEVELDFNKVVDMIENNLNNFINDKALSLLSNKYNNLTEEIDSVQKILESQRKKIEFESGF